MRRKEGKHQILFFPSNSILRPVMILLEYDDIRSQLEYNRYMALMR